MVCRNTSTHKQVGLHHHSFACKMECPSIFRFLIDDDVHFITPPCSFLLSNLRSPLGVETRGEAATGRRERDDGDTCPHRCCSGWRFSVFSPTCPLLASSVKTNLQTSRSWSHEAHAAGQLSPDILPSERREVGMSSFH